MDRFDKMIKERVENEKWKVPGNIDSVIDNALNNLPEKRVSRRTPLKILIPAAIIALLTATTVFAAASPAVRDAVSSVISYFQGDSDAKYISDRQNLERFNTALGITVEDKGIKLTVDNIAVDDNFLNVFYTIESDKPIPKKDENQSFAAFFAFPFIDYKINGKELAPLNNNDTDAYFESEYKLKAMNRRNISGTSLTDIIELEISTKEIFDTPGSWRISTLVDRAEVADDTNTVEPKLEASFVVDGEAHKITIDKVSISPFGSQMLISERVPAGKDIFELFALFDEKGNSLDVLNTDHTQQSMGKTINAFEFVKAGMDTKYLTLVPIEIKPDDSPRPVADPASCTEKLPVVLKVGEHGSIVVEDIDFTEKQIRITYHKEGIKLFDPAFLFFDEKGNEISLNDAVLETVVDRREGRYTQILTPYKSNPDLLRIAKISTFADEEFELLYDQQIKIELK